MTRRTQVERFAVRTLVRRFAGADRYAGCRPLTQEAIMQRTEDELQLEGLLLTADYPTRITYGHGGARA
jgi:hypothetical protein